MDQRSAVTLEKAEISDCSDFQKKCLESFAEIAFKHNTETQFKIFGVGICLVISNLMTSLGITKTDDFLADLVDNIKRSHKIIQKNASYMAYKNGTKVSEGNFN